MNDRVNMMAVCVCGRAIEAYVGYAAGQRFVGSPQAVLDHRAATGCVCTSASLIELPRIVQFPEPIAT